MSIKNKHYRMCDENVPKASMSAGPKWVRGPKWSCPVLGPDKWSELDPNISILTQTSEKEYISAFNPDTVTPVLLLR